MADKWGNKVLKDSPCGKRGVERPSSRWVHNITFNVRDLRKPRTEWVEDSRRSRIIVGLGSSTFSASQA